MKIIIPPVEIWEEPLTITGEPQAELKISDEESRKHLQIRVFKKMEFPKEGGALVYYKGYEYPQKMITHPVAVMKVAFVKRSLLDLLPFLWIEFVRNRWLKYAQMVFETLNSKGFGAFGTGFLKPQFYCDSAREIHRAGVKLAKTYNEKLLVRIICMIWEFDNSYRYRGQHAIGLINKKNLLKKPVRELLRVLKEVQKREKNPSIAVKLKKIKKVLWLIAFMPKIKEFIKKFAVEADFEKIKLSKTDLFWCSLRPDYEWN